MPRAGKDRRVHLQDQVLAAGPVDDDDALGLLALLATLAGDVHQLKALQDTGRVGVDRGRAAGGRRWAGRTCLGRGCLRGCRRCCKARGCRRWR